MLKLLLTPEQTGKYFICKDVVSPLILYTKELNYTNKRKVYLMSEDIVVFS